MRESEAKGERGKEDRGRREREENGVYVIFLWSFLTSGIVAL
jgi:hypothetical protein